MNPRSQNEPSPRERSAFAMPKVLPVEFPVRVVAFACDIRRWPRSRPPLDLKDRRVRHLDPRKPPGRDFRTLRPRNLVRVKWLHQLPVVLFCFALVALATGQGRAGEVTPRETNAVSMVIEAAGRVQSAAAGRTNWQAAGLGAVLGIGDRLRTHANSRAAIQLSDRSIVRLDENTTLEILPPRQSEKRRFRLPGGSLFFFNREKPADIEFDTPLAAGAIRGTEFLLSVADGAAALRLALIDGAVALQTAAGEIALQRGEELNYTRGQAPRVTPLVNAVNTIQWALYYPAVANPDDLGLSADAARALGDSLQAYRAGDLLAALAALPVEPPDAGPAVRGFQAAVELSAGRVAMVETRLTTLPAETSARVALTELIATVKGESASTNRAPRTSSEFLARSYTLQARANLAGALAAAQTAARMATNFGFAWARVAELEMSFGRRRQAMAALNEALKLSPRLPTAHALRGFVLLDQDKDREALAAFDQARALDAGYGLAWLGRGLCLERRRRLPEALASFQAAAALEPQRALFRAYLGKAAGALGDRRGADKELALARRLDPNDPTAFLYSALQFWDENRINESIRDLQRSIDLNDQRAIFRSRLLLDQDLSVRSANLAAIFDDAGLDDVSRHTASRAVAQDYGNFSSHLFLANSYQRLEDVNRFDLRFETVRQSELLMANLLAPPGGGNLSQLLSQQEHLRYFDPRPVGLSSLTQYGSAGDWREAGTVFGTAAGLSYAFDALYESVQGQWPNDDATRRQFFLTLKQRVTADDQFYFQAGVLNAEAGDAARYYDPTQAKQGFNVSEDQQPTLYAGWHHTWSPESHTLLLFGRLEDDLAYQDPRPNVLFLRRRDWAITSVSTPPGFDLDYSSRFTLYSAELQHFWQTPTFSLVVGGRWQAGSVDAEAILNRMLTGVVTGQQVENSLQRGDLYTYASWKVAEPLQLIAGLSYDYVSYPANADLPPVTEGQASTDLLAPKVGLLLTPWKRGVFRASYTRSLGGLYFDNSVRLEPTQIAGFNQAFRSLIPESVVGLVPGTQFDTAGVGFDQSLPSGTFFGVEGEWLTSDGERTVGALSNSGFLPIPDTAISTRQTLDFRERSLSAYAAQLIGNYLSVSVRYRLSDADLDTQFPDIPVTTLGLRGIEQHESSLLNQVALAANFNHPCGFYAQWVSEWFGQSNSGYTPAQPGSDFWQHNLWLGYRFPRRTAEVRFGVLNLGNNDYRLSPLNLHPFLPRERTYTLSLRLNF